MKNKDIVKYFYEVIVSENLLDELSKYISEDCVQRTGEREIFIGIDGMKQHLVALKKTYPDYTMKIIRQYVADDYVISEFIMRGTHKGEFIGITPTNFDLSISRASIPGKSSVFKALSPFLISLFPCFFPYEKI
nr:ester cyclase [uncultured Oscillibacter sp.]